MSLEDYVRQTIPNYLGELGLEGSSAERALREYQAYVLTEDAGGKPLGFRAWLELPVNSWLRR